MNEKNNIIKKLNKKHFNLVNGKTYIEELMKKKSYFFLSPWGYVFEKNFWDKYKFKFSKNYIMEDSGLIPIVLLNAKKVISIDYYGYYYIQTNESIMRTNNENKILFKTKSILYQYDCLMSFISKTNIDKQFKMLFDDYFAGWLLWYGTTLENKYLPNYIKELNKRKILKKLKKNNIKVLIKILICKIDYKLYFKLYNIFHK